MNITACLALGLTLMICLAQPGEARLKIVDQKAAEPLKPGELTKPTSEIPFTTLAVHNVGNFFLSVTNWGFFGSQAGDFKDPKTGLPAPGAEFPAGSNIDYLFQGALWISAISGIDTLTSTGHDGWQHIAEMYPETFENGGDIIERSTRPGTEYFDRDAVSEQDFIAEYTDTLTDQQFVSPDPFTGPHVPLFIKIHQNSYSWSYSYAQDFVLLDFLLENIGVDSLRQLYMGLYIDADVYHKSRRGDGFQDDICGFRHAVPNPAGGKLCGSDEVLQDSIFIAWIADNDGDPVGGIFDYRSPDAVTATRVVRSPTPPGGCGPTPLDYSFNWWVSNGNAALDWGPQHKPGDLNFSGGYGTPDGDAAKYRFMSNGEFDYDEIYSAVDFSDSTGPGNPSGWMPPNARQAATFADGYDTRYLLSFGPFNIGPGESLPVTVGYIAGEQFHVNADNIRNLPDNPSEFYKNLDFTDLAVNSQWAAWVFDNPGVDTPDPETGELDGCRGLFYLTNCNTDSISEGEIICGDCDTVWYAGDGIPDYEGPPPPLSPQLTITTTPGKVVIEWNGLGPDSNGTEIKQDPFSFLKDFEGYRVYMADLNQVASYALVASWDKYDFKPFWEDTTKPVGGDNRWVYREFPLTLDELRAKFADPNFDAYDYPDKQNPYTAPTGQRYYFVPEDWNQANEYFDEPTGETVLNEIQRFDVDSVYKEVEGVWYKYGKYRFEIDGLLASQAYYFAVTAFDYGYPQNGLEPLESSPLINGELVYPANSADVVEEQNLDVSVYPNPYKISADYRGSRYEDPYRQGWSERDRRIHFVNLPSHATIRIFTLDGDIVREFEHHEGGVFSDTDSKAFWDLISRNTQAVVSGIYLYSIESEGRTQVGKIVIIK